ncbi:MAG TPA: hypothetical protein VGJ55_13480 [Pyrinomonadaceae bacterium]|jgi:hypothetical protein
MYCPQCGTESGSGLQYCRSCGANLKVIGKALTLSEAIARSDRGPLPKIKEMIKNLRIEHVTDEVSGALERMNQEIVNTTPFRKSGRRWRWIEKKTAEERREKHLVKGTVSMFTGVGLMIFLYYFSAALVLKLPPNVMAEIPFEVDPVVRVLWLLGLIPTLSGAGRIVAGLLIRPTRHVNIDANIANASAISEPQSEIRNSSSGPPASVTENTTNLLK